MFNDDNVALTSINLQTAVQIDREWMQKLVAAKRQKKSIDEQLIECWNTVINPFSTTLHVLENVYMFETGMLNVFIWSCKQELSSY